jgi:hypothetical protein
VKTGKKILQDLKTGATDVSGLSHIHHTLAGAARQNSGMRFLVAL